MIHQIILVGIGGAVGSILRYLTSIVTLKFYTSTYPLVTFIINMLGCLLIGLLVGLIPYNSNLRYLLIIGFCGGYTTFSAFSIEVLSLIDGNHIGLAILYALSSVILGVVLVWFGMYLSK